jgi:6-pyruvoyltetrahydropterin/6-carboxytetrahydropterin synthase
MFKISKEFHFSASHILNGLKDGHPCMRMHGHNYVVTFCFKAEALNDTGFVVDYRDLDCIKQYIDDVLDHRHLNDVMVGVNPSAEIIAKFLFERFFPQFSSLYKVKVSETPKTIAIYEI